MKIDLSPERLAKLSYHVEQFIALELGQVVPYISIIYTHQGKIAFFTNRKDNEEVLIALECAIEAIKGNADFKAIAKDGEIV
jgi:hypothetical protein